MATLNGWMRWAVAAGTGAALLAGGACKGARDSAAGAGVLHAGSPPPEITGPTAMTAGHVPTPPEVAHLTLAIDGTAGRDSAQLGRGRFIGVRGTDSVVAELLDADGRALGDTGRMAVADLDGDGSIEGAAVLEVRRGRDTSQSLVIVGDRGGWLAELARSRLGTGARLSQLRLMATRRGGDVRVVLARGASAGVAARSEVRWYRFSREPAGGRILVVADTAGPAAAAIGADSTPARHHH